MAICCTFDYAISEPNDVQTIWFNRYCFLPYYICMHNKIIFTRVKGRLTLGPWYKQQKITDLVGNNTNLTVFVLVVLCSGAAHTTQ